MSEVPFIPFQRSAIGGGMAVTIFAALSVLALLSVALRIVWLGLRLFVSRNKIQPQEYVFFHTQLGHYAACLLVANLFNSIAGLIGISWLSAGGITEDGLCIAQAVMSQIGAWATGYFTVSIAIHTFNTLVLRKRQSVLVSAVTISVGWICGLLLAFIPHLRQMSDGSLYGSDGLSCGIRSNHLKSQFFLRLLPIFIASICSAVLYSIIFLVLRGTLIIKGGLKLTLDPNERWNAEGVGINYHRFIASIARSMLWYPIAYIALLLPYSVLRMLIISGFTVPFGPTILAHVLWFILGIMNVALLYNTFRVLGPAIDGRSFSIPKDNESFGTDRSYKPSGSFGKVDINEHLSLPYQYSAPHSARPRSPPQARIATRPGQVSTVESFYSYPSSPSVGRNLKNTRNRSLLSTEAGSLSFFSRTSTYGHVQQEPATSFGLPAPPRSTRVAIKHDPTSGDLGPLVWTNIDLGASVHKLAIGGQHAQNYSPNKSRAHADMHSISSSSSYASQRAHDGGLVRPPALSAVTENFGRSSSSEHTSSLLSIPVVIHHPSESIVTPIIGPVPMGRQKTALAANRVQSNESTRVTSYAAQFYHSP